MGEMNNFAEDVFTDVECIVPVSWEPVEEVEVGSRERQRESMNLLHIVSVQSITQENLNLEFKRLKKQKQSTLDTFS